MSLPTALHVLLPSFHRQISLLVASDPFPLLRGATRVAWIRDITHVATTISISLNHPFGNFATIRMQYEHVSGGLNKALREPSVLISH
jgi:hypothetical protein